MQLMNGVSHMLPLVVGGGILIALAFYWMIIPLIHLTFGKNTPLAAYLKTIGEQAFGMMLPILAGFIAMSIADRPGLAVGLVAGLIAKNGFYFCKSCRRRCKRPVSWAHYLQVLQGVSLS